MVEQNENFLNGIKQISAYTGKAYDTLILWKQRQGFPMRNIDGSWISDRLLVDDWWREQIRKEHGLEHKHKPALKHRNKKKKEKNRVK